MAEEITAPENQDLPGDEPEIEELAEPGEDVPETEESEEDQLDTLEEEPEKPTKPTKKIAGQFDTVEQIEQAYFRSQQELNEERKGKKPEAPATKTAEEIQYEVANKYYATQLKLARLKNPDLDEESILEIAKEEALSKADDEIRQETRLIQVKTELEIVASPDYGEIQRLQKTHPELAGLNSQAMRTLADIIRKEKGITSGQRAKDADRETARGQKARARTLSPGRDNAGQNAGKATATKQEYDYYARSGLTKADVDKYNAAQKGGKR